MFSKLRLGNNQGFTLIELLLVITIIIILASIVLIAINPARNIAQANNAQRYSDVNTIINAIHQYTIDNDGILPSAITSVDTEICQTDASSCSGLIDLSAVTFEERYVLELPTDPTSASTNGTGYYVQKDAYDRITISAPFAQLSATIEVSR
ncbi:MAG: prepilin-type N-terminal cleavage/methylation domain-containing protein [Patescibacteria group bacterium]|nr:prepilin-type N-terminal cleavage/methylation domain-containing protein [Patescibacteria group bacterium]MBU2508819.1 prepilin-type N-terminal cleavage/methylation domain-containing protein [Patescibacteria group bacterium]